MIRDLCDTPLISQSRKKEINPTDSQRRLNLAHIVEGGSCTVPDSSAPSEQWVDSLQELQ